MNELIKPFFIVCLICVAWLKFCQTLKNNKLLSSEVSRKFIHIGTGVLFCLAWPVFPIENYWSRVVAGLIPLIISIQFTLIGIGFIKDQKTVDSMSRSGRPSELLLGPVSYGIIITLLPMLYWFESPIAIITIGILCFGDGFAAIFGTKFGKNYTLPYNREKTFVGTFAFFIMSFLGTFFLVNTLQTYLLIPSLLLIKPLLIVCAICAIVESLPLKDWDNITIALSSIITLNILGY